LYKTIGVIGAGTMGTGLAVDLVLHDIGVVLVDQTIDILERSFKEVLTQVRLAPMLNKQLSPLSRENVQEKLRCTTRLEDVNDCEWIIENVSENIATKEMVYKRLDQICSQNVFFSANTSCIPITRIASFTQRPERIIGIHFMNPVYLKGCVETIRGVHTSQACVQATRDLLTQLDKEVVLVNDFPGFVSNRISHVFMNEAAFVVQDQVASHKEVDDLFVKCYGHAMGPLQTADLIGLDIVVQSLDVLYQSYQDSKFRCCPLLRKMVDAGWLGKKSGRGFYTY
jgi:3-hydroxybutyryl-CoA dehydrogenase